MVCLVFPSLDALAAVLRSGLVPAEVAARPVGVVAGGPEGAIELVPEGGVSEGLRTALATFGVECRRVPRTERTVSCWLELVPCAGAAGALDRLPQLLLAVAPASAPAPAPAKGRAPGGRRAPGRHRGAAVGLAELCGELLRLGCDRFEVCADASDAWAGLVRVREPPFFVVARALDGEGGLRAFAPAVARARRGDGEPWPRVWIELGAAHPLVEHLEEPKVGWVLIQRDGTWRRGREGTWRGVDALLEAPALAPPRRLVPSRPPSLRVTLRLVRGAASAPGVLFVAKGGVEATEALARALPQSALEQLLFLVADGTVLLQLRPGAQGELGGLPGTAYAPVAELPNLYAPVGHRVEPPLRRDFLRAWLAPVDEELTWLEPSERGFERFSVPEAAFRPLSEWVDYVVDGAATALEAWAGTARFDFEGFTSDDVVEAAAEPERANALSPRARASGGSRGAEAGRVAAQPGEEGTATSDARAARGEVRRVEPEAERATERANEPAAERAAERADEAGAGRGSERAVDAEARLGAGTPAELDVAIAREERAFLAQEGEVDARERLEAWGRLAELYARADHRREAGLAFARALWSAEPAAARSLADRWAATAGPSLDALLALDAPRVEETRAVVAQLFRAALAPGAPLPLERIVAFLDRFDDDLDVRSLWLGRVAMARLSGGDVLALARARDRLLRRLQRGLSLERDVPRLIRGVARGRSGERAQRVCAQLEQLQRAFDETPRKRSAVEAPFARTRPYVALEFAWGFARVGLSERTQRLRDEAFAQLDREHVAHDFLTRAYGHRIDQALEGLSPETPLPAATAARLNELEPYVRYKVDRLRQASVVLEPQERLDVFGAFSRASGSLRGDELSALRALARLDELKRALEERAGAAADPSLPEDERARVLDGLVDFLPQLPESQALELLQRLVLEAEPLAPRLRLQVLEDALRVAGHFGRASAVRQYVHRLTSLIKELGVEGIRELGATLVSGLRSLRRVGLRDEAASLLACAEGVLRGDDPATLRARLALAAGYAYLGSADRARPALDDAQARLAREGGMGMPDRLRLTRSAATALGHAPIDMALAGLARLARQLPWITDSFTTNEYYCVSLIDFADALVVGHVGEDLTVTETTRRYLDEDEQSVRRRVHRDLEGADP